MQTDTAGNKWYMGSRNDTHN